MNAPVLLAQLSGSTAQTTPSPKNLKLEKPQNGQAVTVHLDGNTKLDFADVASEKLTFVRVGEKLIILFDNQSTVTVDPVFDSMGKPLTDLSFDMGADRTLTGDQFAQLFPITTDQSVLPAAGGASGPTGGANFSAASVGALGASGARLALLGNEDGAGGSGDATQPAATVTPIIGNVVVATINEDGLAGGNPGGVGDTGGVLVFTGSLNVDFGSDGGGRRFEFNATQPASLTNLTSDGQAVHLLTTTVNGQPTLIGYVGNNPNDAASQVFTVSLDANPINGEYTFTLLRPLDHVVGGTEDTLSLSIGVTAIDGSGDEAVTTITVNVNDDTPAVIAANETHATLTDPASGVVSQGGSLGISWGADRFNDHVDGGVSSTNGHTGDRSVIFANTTVTATGHAGDTTGAITSLTSNGSTVHYVLLDNGTVLVGYTGETAPTALPSGAEGAAASHVVFTVSLSDASDSGSYVISQYQPLDHTNGTQTFGSLDLQFNFTATDSDGDPAAGTLSVTIADTVPTLGETVAAQTVGEDGLSSANPTGPEGGFDAVDNKSLTNIALNINWGSDHDTRGAGDNYGRTLSFLSGGETQAALGGGAVSSLALAISGENGSALTSGGVALQYVVMVNVDGGETLTAFKGTPGEGNAIFTLTLDPTSTNGSYSFNLIGELDHASNSNSIGLTFTVQAADADGDTINTSFTVNVQDDVPTTGEPVAAQTVGEDGLSGANPTGPEGGFDAVDNVSLSNVALNLNWGADNDTRGQGEGDNFGRTLSFLSGGGDAQTALGSGAVSSLALVISGENGSALTSGGVELQYVVTVNADGGETLTAYKGTPGEGNAVFTLTLDPTSTHGSYSFNLTGELDHASNSNSIGLTFSVQAADADGDTINTSFTLNVQDDVPTVGAAVAAQTVGEDGLSGANATGGSYDAADNASLSNVALNVNWGADNDTRSSGDNFGRTLSFLSGGETQVALGQGTVSSLALVVSGENGSALTSGGVALQYVVTANADGGETLTAYRGTPGESNAVFTLTLDPTSANGSYSFNLIGELDHASNSNSIGLTFAVQAADADGDTINTSFTVNVQDDVPTVGTSVASQNVGEDGLSGANASGGSYDAVDNASLTNIALNVNWGADDDIRTGSGDLVGRTLSFNMSSGVPLDSTGHALALTSDGASLDYVVTSLSNGGQQLLVYNSSIHNASTLVFTVTLDPTAAHGSYSFTLNGNLDHPATGPNSNDLPLNFGVTATDADGDSVPTNFTVHVQDDVPTIGTVAGGQVDEDGGLPGGNPFGSGDAFLVGTTTSHSLNISWGADNHDTGTTSNRSATFATDLAAPAGLTADGVQVVYSYNADHTVLTASAGGHDVFRVTLNDSGSGTYTFQLLGNLDHPVAGTEDNLTLTFGFIATDSDGDSTPTKTFDVSVNDDTPVIVLPIPGFVNEDSLAGGNPGGIGDIPLTTATSSNTLGIFWGADSANSAVDGGFSGTQVNGDRSVVFASGVTAALTALNLHSNGAALHYEVSPDGTLLTAYTGADSSANHVFTVSLSDTDFGSYTFTLLGNLDHPTGHNENNININFGFVARDSDGDPTSSSFTVTVNDDTPTIVQAEVSGGVATTDPLSGGSSVGTGTSLGIHWGADAGNSGTADRSVVFTNSIVTAVGDGATAIAHLQSGGLDVQYVILGGSTLVAYTGLTAPTTVPANASDAAAAHVVFVATVSDADADGGFAITQYAPLDHDVGATTFSSIDLTFHFTATDSDGDPVSGTFSTTVGDTVPVATATILAGSVYESELSTITGDLSTGTQAGNPDNKNGDTGPDDSILTGNVSSLVSFGADVPGTFVVEMTNLAQSLTSLTSHGVTLHYTVDSSTNTLIGWAGANQIFTFAVNPTTGDYTFTLTGPLDHVGAGNYTIENMLVPAAAIDNPGEIYAVAAITGNAHAFEGRLPDGDVIIRVTNSGNTAVNWILDNTSGGTDYPLSIAANTTIFINVGQINSIQHFDITGVGAPSGQLTVNPGHPDIVFSAGGADALALDLSSAITARDGDGDSVALHDQLVITVVDDAPVTTGTPVSGSVSEAGLPLVSGDAHSLKIAFGADGLSGLLTFAVDSHGDPLHPAGLTSDGVALAYTLQTLGSGEQQLVAYKVTETAGSPVFEVTLNSPVNPTYIFTLYQNLDHAPGSNNLPLNFTVVATDADGDALNVPITVRIVDDVPVATAAAQAVTVSEVGLPLVDAHTGFLNVSWGADKGAAKHLNFAKDGDGHVVGPVLHSNGVLLAYRIEPESAGSDNERLIAYRVDDPSQSAVFSITLYEPGNPYYTVALFGPLDHAPGSDPLTLGFTVVATDADGDSLNVPITVRIVDDVPVATGAAQAVTVSEVGLPLVDAHTGFLNVSWGADKGAAKHLNFAKDGNGAIIGPVLHSDGVLLAYRVEPVSPGSDNERLVAYRVDDPSQSAVFSITLYEPGNPYYTVALFGPLDHAPGSDPLTLGFTVVATDADGDSLNVPISVVIVDSVPTAGPGDASSVSEHDLTTQIGFGQGFESATDSTSAGFVDGGVNGHLAIKASGADGIDTKTHSGNYALVTQTAGESAPFTRFGGYDSTFDGGFKASVDIYLDPSRIGTNEGFDYSVAVNKADGSFLRDFIFHVTKDASGHIFIGASNNTGFDPQLNLGDGLHGDVTAAGWYTFTQTFHDDGTGKLAVDMVVRDASGAVVFTQTIASGDLIADTGGHRYGWFTNVDVANGIAIDNVTLTQHDDSTSATSVSGSLHVSAGADGLASLTFGGIVDGSAVTDSSNHAVTSGTQAVTYHVVDSHTLEGVTAGGQVIFTVTLDPVTGGYNFVLAHQIDHPVPGTDGLGLRFGYVVTDGDGDTASSTFTVTVTDDVPTIVGPSTPVNLLTNGDFAGGIFAHTESWGQWATDDTGWKISGTTPGQTGVQLERIESGYLGVVTSNGHPMVDLAASPGDIAISQSINGLPPGQHYTLSFEIGASNPSSAGLEVYWNGQLVGTYHPGSTMAIQTLDLIAQTDPNNAHPANTVTFKEIGSAGDNTGTYLANVSLVQASSDSLPVFHASIGEDGASVVTLVNGTDFHFGADGPGSVTFDSTHATMSTPTGTTLGMPTLSYDPVTGKLTVDPGWGFGGLSEGEIATLSVPFTVTDSDGDTKTGIYQFTITGTNDAVSTSIGFPDGGTMTEYAETDPQTASTADRTRFTDSSWGGGYNGGGFWIYDDQGDAHTVTVVPPAGAIGYITATIGEETANDGAGFVNWQYHVTDAQLNFLGAGETQQEVFRILVSDGHGSSAYRDITVTLVGSNDRPVISIDGGDGDYVFLTETNAGLTANGSLSVTDVDLSDTVTASVLSVTASGSGIGSHFTNAQLLAFMTVAAGDVTPAGSATGDLAWTFNSQGQAFDFLPNGWESVLSYTIQVSDGHGGMDTHVVEIKLHGTNDVAVIGTPTVSSVIEDQGVVGGMLTASGSISVSDADDGQSLLQTAVTPVGTVLGSLVLASNGSYTYSVANSAVQYLGANETRVETFTIKSLDGTSKDVSFTITGTNDAPVVDLNGAATAGNDVSVTAVERLPQWIMSDATIADVDSTQMHSMTVTLTSQPDGLGVEGLSLNTAASSALTAALLTSTYNATTGVLTISGDASTATYQTILQGVVYQYTGHNPSAGDRSVTVVVNDDVDSSIVHTATVHVLPINEPPVLGGTLTATVVEGQSHTLTAGELGYTDPDNTTSEVVFHVSGVQHGTIMNGGAPATSFTAFELAAGLITFTHDGSDGSPTTFQVYVEDGNQDGSTPVPGTFTFTVNGVNDAPVNTLPAGPLTVAEDTPLAITGLSISDSDAGTSSVTTTLSVTSGMLTVLGGSGVTVAGNGSATVTLTGSQADINAALALANGVVYQDALNHNGGVDLTVTTSDLGHSGSGGVLTDSDTIHINVTPVNDAPTPQNDFYVTNEDHNVTFNVLANDTDPDGNVLHLTGGLGGFQGLFDGASLESNGNLTVRTTENASGTVVLTYQVTDGTLTTQATATVDIRPVADNAVLTASGGNEDSTFAVHIALGDTDGSEKATHIELSGYPAGTTFNQGSLQNGVWVIDNPAGIDLAHLTMTPPGNYNGGFNLGVSVTVVDHATLTTGLATDTATSTGTIAVTVNPVNDAPTAVSFDNATTSLAEGTSTASHIKVADITVTDDGQGTNDLTLSGADAASFEIIGNALYLKAGVTLDYETKTSYSVSVDVDDTTVGGTPDLSTTFTLNVTDVAPVITSPTAVSVAEGTSAATTVYTAVAADPAGGTVTYALTGADAAAFTIDNSTGAVHFNAVPNYETKSSYSFNVQASDPSNQFSTQAVTINVTDLAPVITSPTAVSIAEGTSAATTVYTAAAADPAGGTVTYALTGADAAAFTINSSTGEVHFNAAPNFEAKSSYSFNVQASDPSNQSSTQAVTINVTDVAPTAVAESYNASEDTLLTIATAQGVLGNDSDVAGGTLNAVLVSGPANAASFALNADGSFSYQAAANYAGPDSFTYKASDGTLNSNTVTVNLTVAAVDDGTATLTIADSTQTATAPKVGDVLQAALGADPDGAQSNIVYHWLRDGTEVSSGSSSTYTLGSADLSHKISAFATYKDGQNFNDTTLTTAQTATVIANNNAPAFTTSDVAGGVVEDAGTTQGSSVVVNGNFDNYDSSTLFAAGWTPSASDFWGTAFYANRAGVTYTSMGMQEYGGNYGISQSGIATTAGVSYLIDFWVREFSANETLYVQWNGATVAAASDASGGWKEYKVVVTGTGSDTLTFLADDPYYGGLWMDDVSVTKFTANTTQTASGVLHFTDEAADTHTASFTQGSTLNSAGTAYLGTFSLDPSVTETSGTDSLGWYFSASNSALQSLAAGQTVTQTYEVAVTDNHAATTVKEVTVTLTGVNDAPVFGSGTATGVVAQSTLPTGNLLTNGGFDSHDTTGWTVVKQANTYAQVDNLFNFSSGNLWNFDVYGTNPSTREGIATISQSISTVAGQHYLLAFDYAGAYGLSSDSTLKVSWAGAQIISLTGIQNTNTDSGHDTPYTYLVTGDGGSDALTFAFDAKNDEIRIDSVSLVRAEVAQGSISFSDVDLTDNAHTVSVASKTTNPYGKMTATVDEATDQVNWTFVVKESEISGLAVGQSVNETYTLTLDDHHGGVVTKDVTVTVNGLPGAPVITGITPASDSGTVGDNITNDTTPSFVGTALAYSTVTVKDGATVLGTTTADATGAWTFTPDAAHALSATTHSTITATATDIAGHVSAASANYTLKIDTTAPSSLATATLDLTDASDSAGASNSDNITKVTTPTITVGHLNGTPMSIGDVIQIIDTNHGNALVGSYTVQAGDLNGSSQWQSGSGSKDIVLTTLVDGAHNFTVQLVDSAGNAGTQGGTLTVTEDTTAPSAPTGLDLDAADDTGWSKDGITKNTTDLTISGSGETGATVTLFDDVNNNGTQDSGETTLGTVTIASGTSFSKDITLAAGLHHVGSFQTDVAGNVSAGASRLDINVDNTAPTLTASTPADNATGVGYSKNIVLTFSEAVAPRSGSILISNGGGDTRTIFLSSSEVTVSGNTVTINPSSNLIVNTNYYVQIASGALVDVAGNAYAGISNTTTLNFKTGFSAPAGASGEEINLALSSPSDAISGPVSLTVTGVPVGWTLSEGIHNADGSWSVATDHIGSLSVTSPDGYTGALVLQVTETWTNADGSTGHAYIADNVEAYAKGAPIFAWSGDDTLTASGGADTLVFANKIGTDVVHHFDTVHDKIDLIGFAGFSSFADVQAHLGTDAAGNAIITLGDGQTITLNGVSAAALSADDFLFNETPVTHNAGDIVLSDGALMPFSGTLDNTGSIHLASTGAETAFEIVQRGLTLLGGGSVTLSDSSSNVIFGSADDVTLTNVDNVISGAGQLGDGHLTLVNEGTILATGSNALVIDTGDNAVINTGTLEAIGTGGLDVHSGVVNDGLLWANGANLDLDGNVSGSGSALLSGHASLELGGSFNEQILFDSTAEGTLVLDHSADFHGMLSGFDGNDTIDLSDILAGTASLNYTENAQGTGGVLTVTDGTHTANIAFAGQYSTADFRLGSDLGNHALVQLENQAHQLTNAA
jgi:T1SS-143 domain-containing protein